MMSNELDDCFQELLEAKREVLGKDEFVLLNGKKKSAIVSEITTDEAFISGGIAEAGTFVCSIAQSSQPQEPEALTPIEVRGKRLQILSVVNRNGATWEITAGDPTKGQR